MTKTVKVKGYNRSKPTKRKKARGKSQTKAPKVPKAPKLGGRQTKLF